MGALERRQQMSVNADEMFFSTATQYYVGGRFAAFAGLLPVVGNLLHHAIEMYLKGGLSKTKTLAELKDFGHNLPGVWSEFKAAFVDPTLAQFDRVVSALHAFEELRYPDSVLAKGMECTVSIKRPSSGGTASGPAGSAPQYHLCLEEIDQLVAKIFGVASLNPKFFTARLNKYARQYLNEENAESGLTSA
jgi:hypothetical protein